MDDAVAGPSGVKKCKVTTYSSKKLSDSELLRILEDSSDEETYSDDDFDLFVPDESDENTDTDDNDQDTVLPTIDPTTTNVTIRKWSEVPMNMKHFQFTKTNELLQAIPGNEPIDYFRKILDDAFLDLLVTETNYYAEDLFLSAGVSDKSRITRWKPVTSSEMLTFIGLVLHTGTIRLNRLQDYWKGHPLFNLKCFSQHMSRDRFLLMMRCLHFSRNIPGQSENDRLYKVRPVIDFFNNKMEELYYPGKQLSLDESMVLWRGRLVFRQYIKNKRHKYGIKLYMLTEPDGTILRSLVYTGALDDNIGGKGHTTKVVLDLLQNYLDSRHSVYLDNFYNSVELAEQLTSRNTYCTGTLNSIRKSNPKELITKKIKKGETAAVYSDNIMVGKWKDKRDVLYISNEHGNEMVEFVNKRNQNKQKPAPIFHYNKFMGGVDHQDQMNAYYPCDRKTLRWNKKLGIHFIQLMFLNSYFLYKKHSRRNISFYNFRISVLEELLDVKQTKATPMIRVSTAHTLTKITDVNKKGETNRKRCRVCSQKKIRKMTLYHCEKCPERPGLCVGECFDIFHA